MGTNGQTIQEVVDVQLNGNVVQAANAIEKALKQANQQFVDMSDLIDKIEKKVGNVTKTINNNQQTFQKNSNYNFNTAVPTVAGKSGAISSPNGASDQAFRQMEQQVIASQAEYNAKLKEQTKTQAEITALKKAQAAKIAEETKYLGQLAKAAKDTADANLYNALHKKSKEYIDNLNSKTNLNNARASALSSSQGWRDRRNTVFERQNHGVTGFFHSARQGFNDARSQSLLGSAGGLLDKGLTGALTKTTGFGTALGIATQQLIKFGGAALDAFGKMETLSTQLEIVYGSKTESDAAFSQIQQYATRSPFGVTQSTEMAVLLKQSGVYASELFDTLKMIGDVSSGNNEKMKRIANNYAQIQAIGHATMLDMRQFAYAGIPIYKEVADYLSVSQDKLRTMISDGEVTSEIIEDVFKRMTGKGGVFENATSRGAQTMAARQMNLEDMKQIALSNWGEVFWNLGDLKNNGRDSFAQNLIDFSEIFYNWFGDIGETLSMKQKYQNATNADDLLRPLTQAYVDALRDNNPELAESIKNAMNAISGSQVGGEDTITAIRSQHFDKDVRSVLHKQYGKNKDAQIVSDSLYNNLVEQINFFDEVIKGSSGELKKSYLTARKELEKQAKDMIPTSMYHKAMDAVQTAIMPNSEEFIDMMARGGSVKPKEVVADDEYTRRVNSAEDISNLMAQSEYDAKKAELKKSYGISDMELDRWAKFRSIIAEAGIAAEDYYNKMADGAGSLASQTARYTELWKMNTQAGKEVAKQEEKKAYETYSQNYDRVASAYNKETNRFDAKSENVLYAMASGLVRAERLDLSNGGIIGSIKDGRSETLEKLDRNLQEASDILINVIGDSEGSNEKLRAELYDARKAVGDLQYVIKRGNVTDEDFGSLNEHLKNIFDAYFDESKKNTSLVLRQIQLENLGINDKAQDPFEEKKKKEKELEPFVPLWKRIAASATGWDASFINRPTDFMDDYKRYGTRQIVGGGVKGMVSAGMGFGQIERFMRYNGVEDVNKQGMRQKDWERTEQAMLKYAMSMEGGAKKSAMVLNGMADAMRNQLSVYEQLTVNMNNAGEDWATINKDIKGLFQDSPGLGLENIFDNVLDFTSSLEDQYKLVYDDKMGISVADREGKLVGSIDELKKTVDKNSDGLNKYLDKLSLRQLATSIDDERKALQALVNTVSVANSISREASEFEKQGTESRTLAFGGSVGALGVIRNSMVPLQEIANGNKSDFGYKNVAEGYAAKSGLGSESVAGEYIAKSISSILMEIAKTDFYDLTEKQKETFSKLMGDNFLNEKKFDALSEMAKVLQNPDSTYEEQTDAFEKLLKAFEITFGTLIEKAKDAAKAMDEKQQQDAVSAYMRGTDFSLFGTVSKNQYLQKGNSIFEQNLLNKRGLGAYKFGGKGGVSEMMTENAFKNRGDNAPLIDRYGATIRKDMSKQLFFKFKGQGNSSDEAREMARNAMSGFDDSVGSVINDKEKSLSDARDAANNFAQENGIEFDFDKSIESANRFQDSLVSIGEQLVSLGKDVGNVLEKFASSAVTSTFETWGESLATGADSSKALMENFRKLGAGLLSNLGTMITEAGLSMAIHASSMPEVYAGLALAAVGGGLSFLSGYLGADKSDDDDDGTDDEYDRLLRVKEDLTDLLKQAREDAVYYENTVRHRNALSTNGSVSGGTTKVNDAIITPSGDVISTHPDDYLIATKTPQALVGGGGAPTVNFSVIDKSTGIKVTQQKSSYDEEDNSIDFEAIIESKVSEFIMTSKGDDAFNTREARLRGNSYVG